MGQNTFLILLLELSCVQKQGSKPSSALKILVHAFIFLVLGSKTKCQFQSQKVEWSEKRKNFRVQQSDKLWGFFGFIFLFPISSV